jgi:diguanylate cyclase (GGDEF)-like protein/PAS domain S-box-containing protein
MDDFLIPVLETSERPSQAAPCCTIMVVDDDQDVHHAAALALSDKLCLGCELRLLNAFSVAQAREMLNRADDIAIVLLNLEIGNGREGLKLLHDMRNVLNLRVPRIILRLDESRTPPDRDLIAEYDINDHKTKTELTEMLLFPSIMTALRGYRHLHSLEGSMLGLRRVIEATASLCRSPSMEIFSATVLVQLRTILGSETHAILCAREPTDSPSEITMLAASGKYQDCYLHGEHLLLGVEMCAHGYTALISKRHVFEHTSATLYLVTPAESEVLLYLESDRVLAGHDIRLLEMFGQNISLGYARLVALRQLSEIKATLEERVKKRTRALLARQNYLRQFKLAAEQSSASILIVDTVGVILYANQAAMRTSQYGLEELLGQCATVLYPSEDQDSIYQEISTHVLRGFRWQGELRSRRKDGTIVWEEISVSPLRDRNATISRFLVVKEEISERRELEEELRHLASTDPLTGLLNRRSFFLTAEQEIARQHRHPRPLAVAMLDLDHFKSINDRFGHQAGDEALRIFAEVCRRHLREPDFMGRLGGEEFAVMLPETSVEQAMLAMERLRAAVEEIKVQIANDQAISITVSIGITGFEQSDFKIDSALQRADKALYRAKTSGRNGVRASQA